MREVTRKLEPVLGPETGDLCMRFGLHSGYGRAFSMIWGCAGSYYRLSDMKLLLADLQTRDGWGIARGKVAISTFRGYGQFR
jgi:hypothetical protein